MRVLLLALFYCLAPIAALGAPELYSRATLDGPRIEPDVAELRWLWEHRQLRLGVFGHDNPPFNILGTGQAYEGITADYAGLVAEHLRLGVEVLAFASFDEAVAALREGAVDLLGSVNPQQARQAGLRLSQPYTVDRPVLLAADEGSRVRPHGSARFRLAMVEGYRPLVQVQQHYPQAQVQLHSSPLSALAALTLGQADLYLGDTLGAHYVLGRSQLGGVEEVGPAPLPQQHLGFAMADDGGPLPSLVDAALGSLSERQLSRIRERWSPVAVGAVKPTPLQLSEAEQRWLQEHTSVTVLVDEHLLPLSYRDGKSQLRGLSLDMLQLISRRTGLRFEVQGSDDVERMVEQVRQGQAQVIAGLPYSPAREAHLGFSRAFLSASRVLVTQDVPDAPASLAQLEGRSLALVSGSLLQEYLGERHPGIRQLALPGPVQALRAVARGQAAAAALTLDDARPLIARWYPGRLRVSASLSLPPAHFALATARGESELQSILNKALLSLAPRETDALVRRWRNPMIVDDGVWPRYRAKIMVGFAIAVALLLLALLWIRYLRRLQVQLRRATHEADSANRAKTHFLTTMSHEIRTPLHAVLGMLELAQRKAEQGVLDRLAIEVATDAARALLGLIGDVLDITRIEAGHLQLTPQRVRLREQVERVLRLFETQARGKGLELRLDTQGAVDADVMLDPVRFKQILANLLSNAIKFTQRGHVRIRLQAQQGAGRLAVSLTVEDTGIGIAQAELASLGQPFRQASNQRQSPRCSSGLGLSISRSLCQMMGGGMHLASVLGKGTRVQVQLDLALAPGQADTAPAPVPQALPGAVRLRVLVVDDYPANRLLLAQQLDYLGHQARVAEDGSQALRLWLKEHFDVVISDCNMPRLGGHALARAIREHERRSQRPACRLIGLTASALENERRRCQAAGMDDCLFKPLGLDDLVRVLAGCQARVVAGDGAQGLDLAHMEHLVGHDQAALKALLADLRSSNREDLERLESAASDPRQLAELAHRVKGGARIIRARGLIQACEQVERECALGPVSPARLRERAQALHDAMQRLERQLEHQAACSGPV